MKILHLFYTLVFVFDETLIVSAFFSWTTGLTSSNFGTKLSRLNLAEIKDHIYFPKEIILVMYVIFDTYGTFYTRFWLSKCFLTYV